MAFLKPQQAVAGGLAMVDGKKKGDRKQNGLLLSQSIAPTRPQQLAETFFPDGVCFMVPKETPRLLLKCVD